MDKRQVVLVVMDGIGKSQTGIGDAVAKANTPTLDMLFKTCSHIYKGTWRSRDYQATKIWVIVK